MIWFLAASSAVVLVTALLVLGDPEDSGATAACEPELRRGAIPAAGCWRFALRWGSREDALDLAYARRR